MFDGYVFVDEIPKNDDFSAVHIYTRPFDLTSVTPRASLSIYTTALLKSLMVCDENSKVRESIEIINDSGLPYYIELPNQETIRIRAYSSGSKTLNLIILFEYCERYTLYAGRFIANSDILNHKSLRELMQQKKIDDLFIDGTHAHIMDINLRQSACDEIQHLIKKYTNYKFHMLIDDFGYEDLIFDLAKRGISIYLDAPRVELFKRQLLFQHFTSDPYKANIILTNELVSDTNKLFDGGVISIKFSADVPDVISPDVRVIKFSKYPTMDDIHYIIDLTAPLHIYSIGETKCLPFNPNYACRYNDNENNTIEF